MKKSLKQIIFTVSAILFLISVNKGQLFEKVYITQYNQEGTDVVPTPDGGYFVCGYTQNTRADDSDVLTFKTDHEGNMVWKDTVSGLLQDYAHRLIRGTDGDYYIVGHSRSFGGGDYDIILIKMDVNGVEKFRKKYGANGNEIGMDIVATADGNYVIVSSVKASGSQDYNMELRKIRPDGSEVWTKSYGGTFNEYANGVKLCQDGGFIMIGQVYSCNPAQGAAITCSDAYLVRTDSAGNKSWERSYGGPNADEGVYLTVNPDQSMTFLVRDSVSFTRDIDIDVYKVNPTGDTVIWKQTYGGARKDTPKMIQPTADGGYIIGAISRSFGSMTNPDMWIIRLNSSGAEVWNKLYGGANNEHCYTMRELSDGSFIGVGKTQSYGPDMDAILLKVNSAGTLVVGIDENENKGELAFYPNPGAGIIYFDTYKIGPVTVTNIIGQETPFILLHNGIELRDKNPGIYFISYNAGNKIKTQKILVH